ncbi:MAG: tRNA (N(6)-L-threonylcarbamoyladenosine(37)-C(2))-methylthiotransferase MtaB [Planctomycetes bacterium]|nr:tRNA (N(6)-L-threonylcarbamoyladenosine(37)-C(2))-methylthiotransferase MtaB [Planctomycetota bacterium]
MKTFCIYTLGCKVNQYESQQMRQLLEDSGLKQVELADGPDLIMVNTCCVTHIASSKSRQAIRKAQKQNPDADIVVAGCLPAGQTGELNNIPRDILVIDRKNGLPEALNNIIACNTTTDAPSRPIIDTKIKHKKDYRTSQDSLRQYKGQSRAFLKIQDGCDGCCTYCIVPKIRNILSNKPIDEVLAETSTLVYAGHKEIVLTGIFLGAWGRQTVRRKKWDMTINNPLAELVDKVASVDGLKRLRLSSLEPADVTEGLLDIFEKNDNIMPHLHLPLQSGSASTLKRMCRQYTIDAFMDTVEMVKSRLDRPAITTDIIVGFPGETDRDFEDTCNVAKQVEFSKIHTFSFSPRKNTPAFSMENQLAPEVIKGRSQKLHQIDEVLQKKFRKKFIGDQVTAIIEDTDPTKGRTERYFMAQFPNAKNPKKGDLATGILSEDTITAQ